MSKSKSTFALFLGNRGLFPASLISGARAELISTLNGLGHEVLAHGRERHPLRRGRDDPGSGKVRRLPGAEPRQATTA